MFLSFTQDTHLFFSIKDFSLLVFGLAQLLLLEIEIAQVFGEFYSRDVNFGRSGNDKFLVSSAQRNTVDGQGP